jgi:hypothetical protein
MTYISNINSDLVPWVDIFPTQLLVFAQLQKHSATLLSVKHIYYIHNVLAVLNTVEQYKDLFD